jgi:hypothetical protein
MTMLEIQERIDKGKELAKSNNSDLLGYVYPALTGCYSVLLTSAIYELSLHDQQTAERILRHCDKPID